MPAKKVGHDHGSSPLGSGSECESTVNPCANTLSTDPTKDERHITDVSSDYAVLPFMGMSNNEDSGGGDLVITNRALSAQSGSGIHKDSQQGDSQVKVTSWL